MSPSNRKGALWLVVACVGIGTSWCSRTAAQTIPPPPPPPERTMTVGLNGTKQKCRIVNTWKLPEGGHAYQVQTVETGEMLTLVRTTDISEAKEAAVRIYRWENAKTPPKGAPVPPNGVAASKGPSLESSVFSALPSPQFAGPGLPAIPAKLPASVSPPPSVSPPQIASAPQSVSPPRLSEKVVEAPPVIINGSSEPTRPVAASPTKVVTAEPTSPRKNAEVGETITVSAPTKSPASAQSFSTATDPLGQAPWAKPADVTTLQPGRRTVDTASVPAPKKVEPAPASLSLPGLPSLLAAPNLTKIPSPNPVELTAPKANAPSVTTVPSMANAAPATTAPSTAAPARTVTSTTSSNVTPTTPAPAKVATSNKAAPPLIEHAPAKSAAGTSVAQAPNQLPSLPAASPKGHDSARLPTTHTPVVTNGSGHETVVEVSCDGKQVLNCAPGGASASRVHTHLRGRNGETAGDCGLCATPAASCNPCVTGCPSTPDVCADLSTPVEKRSLFQKLTGFWSSPKERATTMACSSPTCSTKPGTHGTLPAGRVTSAGAFPTAASVTGSVDGNAACVTTTDPRGSHGFPTLGGAEASFDPTGMRPTSPAGPRTAKQNRSGYHETDDFFGWLRARAAEIPEQPMLNAFTPAPVPAPQQPAPTMQFNAFGPTQVPYQAPPMAYGAPTYGAPTYGAPNYGAPASPYTMAMPYPRYPMPAMSVSPSAPAYLPPMPPASVLHQTAYAGNPTSPSTGAPVIVPANWAMDRPAIVVASNPNAADPAILIQLMQAIRESPHPYLREWAANSLASYDWRMHPAVVVLLNQVAVSDPAGSVRAACVHSLMRMNAPLSTTFNTLQSLRTDVDVRVRHEVDNALRHMESTR